MGFHKIIIQTEKRQKMVPTSCAGQFMKIFVRRPGRWRDARIGFFVKRSQYQLKRFQRIISRLYLSKYTV